MIFRPTSIAGAFLIDLEPLEDERGFFARSFCTQEFENAGLEHKLVQCSISYNRKRGTLRGMHYQAAPHPEAKLVRVTKGRIYDVLLDVRPESSTFQKWVSFELQADGHSALYVPPGVAHGFQTLEDDTEVFYQMSENFHPESARTLIWNDARFGIRWPIENPILSDKDRRGGA
jgi:dTDP-4-dehydrorhamnose 3,5-epimerase